MNVHASALAALSLVLLPVADPAPVAVATAETATGTTAAERFPAATEGFTVGADSSLEVLLREFSRVTSQNFSMDVTTRELLASTQVGLLNDAVVPAERVYAFVEAVLVDRGMVLFDLQAREPRLLGIQPAETARSRMPPHWTTTFVPESELDAYAEHPALMIQTELHLANVDVRQLGNSLRTLSPDATRMQAIPLANSNCIILQGNGAFITGLARMLKRVDRITEARIAAAPPEDPAEPGE